MSMNSNKWIGNRTDVIRKTVPCHFVPPAAEVEKLALQEPVQILKHDRSLGPYVTLDKDLKPIDLDGRETAYCWCNRWAVSDFCSEKGVARGYGGLLNRAVLS
ncbi:hypothetical protein DBV15_06916 [Temnothorax longispinosus]|uniref:Uncharacterized protein n=1 Tax=Temnothorax longispinosus TaxID=300112 RepID=A0A4V6RGJ6_9HYME|nr:hypothetical protein DBV15_06916 [Temnothorax longispinosus]